jgi:hypothetical protein
LADIDLAAGQLAEARRHAWAAHQAAPAWPLPLQRLASVAQASGAGAAAAAFRRTHDSLVQRLQGVALALG